MATSVNFVLPDTFRGDLVAQSVWRVLTWRGKPECWDSTKSIADRIGRSIRTVQYALKRLKEAGLVAVKVVRSRTGPGCNSGHRIILCETTRELPNLDEPGCVEPAKPVASRSPVPPDPPVEVPEGTRPEAGSSSEPPPPLPPVPVPARKHDSRPEDPDPETPARVLAKAREVLGSEAPAAAQARRYGWAWLDAALERAAAVKARDGSVGWGYVVRTLMGYRDEGGPPAAVVVPPPAPKRNPYDVRLAEQRRKLGITP